MSKLIKKALSKYKQGKYDDAANYYLKILKKDPYHLDANYLLGTLYAEQGQYEKAIAYLQKASEVNPGSPSIQCNLGNVFFLLKQYDKAEPYFLTALQLDPNLAEAHVGLGGVWNAMEKDINTVYGCYEKALALRPNTASIHKAMAMLLSRVGNEDALAHFEKALQLNPEIKGIYDQYGKSLLQAGRKEDSAAMYKRAIEENPDDVAAKYFLCIAEGREPNEETRKAYVQSEFDNYAEKFDEDLVETLGYTIPSQAREMLESISVGDLHFECVADLGCGTGLSGDLFRDSVDKLVGVDIAEQMVEKAKERGCYDELIVSDVISFLESTADTYDLFLALDVIVYLGDLSAFMEVVRKKARPGALLVFSTERSFSDDIECQKSGRYAHSQAYLHSLASQFECSIVAEKHVPIRKEYGPWIMGDLLVFKLP